VVAVQGRGSENPAHVFCAISALPSKEAAIQAVYGVGERSTATCTTW